MVLFLRDDSVSAGLYSCTNPAPSRFSCFGNLWGVSSDSGSGDIPPLRKLHWRQHERDKFPHERRWFRRDTI